MAKTAEPAPIRGETLFERINQIKNEISRVPKTGYNKHFGYAFATESDIADLVRPLCAKYGVGVIYLGLDPGLLNFIEGEKQCLTRLWVDYMVINTDKPDENFRIRVPGEALDGQDKGITKALTQAAKYLWIRLLDISTGDEQDEPDKSGEGQRPKEQARTAPPKPTVKVMGQEGSIRLFAALRARNWDLAKCRMSLYKLGGHYRELLTDDIKDKPELWPAEVMDGLGTVFEKNPVPTPKPAGQPSDDEARALEIIESKWQSETANIKLTESDPKSPREMLDRMLSDKWATGTREEKLKRIVGQLERDEAVYPTGEVIPF